MPDTNPPSQNPSNPGPEFVQDFLDHSGEMLQRIGQGMADLRRSPRDAAAMERISSGLRAIGASAGFLSLADLEETARRADMLLSSARTSTSDIDDAGIEFLTGAIDSIKEQCGRLRDGDHAGHEPEAGPYPFPVQQQEPEAQLAAEMRAAAELSDCFSCEQPFECGGSTGMPVSVPVDAGVSAAAEHMAEQFESSTEPQDAVCGTGTNCSESNSNESNSNEPSGSPEASQAAPMATYADLARIDAMLRDLGALVVQSNRVTSMADNLPGEEACTPLGANVANLAEDLRHATAEIKDSVLGARARTISCLFDRCRDAANAAGPTINWHFTGGEVEADYSVVDRLYGPVMDTVQLLMTCGTRAPGDPTVAVSASAEDNMVAISIFCEQVSIGLGELDEGLEPVRSDARAIRGTVSASRDESGICVEIHVPTNLAFMDAMLVRIDDQTVAVPIECTDQILRTDPSTFARLGALHAVPLDDGIVALLDGRETLGLPEAQEPGPLYPYAIVIRQGDRRVAVSVSKAVGRQEIVMRETDPLVTRMGPVCGAGSREDGSATLILDVPALLLRADRAAGASAVAA